MRASALYPPAVRERWGAEIDDALRDTGARAWPDTLAGAARLWLHPTDWPETRAGQTRRTVAVVLFAILALSTLLLRAVEPSRTLTADTAHPATSLWLAPILLGAALAAPLPPLRREPLRRLAVQSVRTLFAPAAAALALVLTARSGVFASPSAPVGVALLAYYWATLAFIAHRLCVLVARAGTAPSTRRLSAALALIGTGLAVAAAQSAATAVPVTLALAALAIAALATARDLART
ncbi:hypothetical protein [Actinomadura verrucosospora]|uniref:Cation diffusion facilitator family transporter n=1 Tax=Actinomadura verrucosospora TaxID=46165 RepID=A0A7D4A6Q1_ACTVE|nr:hypothetical protein [Actinomadura verrucosospora]QKG23865.1 cation diffusion facilitator family transporter [Actinomadura verrucosospora]